MRLIIHPEASADIREEVDSAIDTIASMPEAFPKRRKNIRMFVLSRFPFSVLYRIRANKDCLEVLVVRHHARHQGYGMDRA
jgi:plasmid stabilization system protein ParE